MKQETDDRLDAFTEAAEGFSKFVYKCPSGFDTIGFGYNLEANPLRLSQEELREFRHKGITRKRAEELIDLEQARIIPLITKNLPEFLSLPEDAQLVLVDMAYNLGVKGLFQFHNTISAIKRGLYDKAAAEMLNSKWARQVKTRAVKLAKIMAEIPDEDNA